MLLATLLEAKKAGTYAGVHFTKETTDQLNSMIRELGVPDPLKTKDFHTTLLYSRKFLPDYKAAGKLSPIPEADSCDYKLEIWPSNSGEKNLLVLTYKCKWLSDRHDYLMEQHGATWDFPDYKPHITLSYDIGDWEPDRMTVEFETPISIAKEYREELELGWSKS